MAAERINNFHDVLGGMILWNLIKKEIFDVALSDFSRKISNSQSLPRHCIRELGGLSWLGRNRKRKEALEVHKKDTALH